MRVKSLQFAQLAAPSEIDGEGELGRLRRWCPPETLGQFAGSLSQRQALGNILGAGFSQ